MSLRRLRWKHESLKRGTLLYHATSSPVRFEEQAPHTPRGPAWFATTPEAARTRVLLGGEGRVLAYRVEELATILRFDHRMERERMAELVGTPPDDTGALARAVGSVGETGWRIHRMYPTGDEVMLVAPERIVGYVGSA